MKSVDKFIKTLLLAAFAVQLAACSNEADLAQSPKIEARAEVALDVYKSPTCSCCGGWIEHVESAGLTTAAHHPADLDRFKAEKGISARYQSCHTAVSPQGYVFEGHIPAKYIAEFLNNPPPDTLGLAVPGMPLGSPGMELGGGFSPYEIWLLKRDGSAEVFAQVNSAEDQY